MGTIEITPAPKPEPRIRQATLTVAVILSLVLGTIGGFVGGELASGNLAHIFNFNRNSTTTTTSSGSSATLTVQEESATVDVVKKVKQSVVSIVITQDLSKYYSQSGLDSPPYSLLFGTNQDSSQEVGSGSGFIVSADGYIMTNRHVAEDTSASYTVITNDNKQYSAKVVATDPVNDIAVLKIDAKDLTPLEWGNSDSLAIGQTVIAIGNALGEYSNTVTKGVISGLARNVTAGDGSSSETLENVIQTDAAINSGNSGGPLLNLDGQVVGMNTAVSSQGQLIAFAIPSNQVQQVFESVLKIGKITRPYLGVRYVTVTQDLKKQNNLSVDYGALVQRGSASSDTAVVSGSPADKAGIVENDIILEIDGVKLDSAHSLSSQIQKHAPGDKITVKLLRDGKDKTVTVTLEEYKSS